MIRPAEDGMNLLAYLVGRFNYHSEAEWQDLIGRNRLLINSRPGRAESCLATSDTVEFIPPDKPEPPVILDYTRIYEDDSIMAVNKPGNLPTHPAGCFFNHTLWALLKHDRPDISIHFVNRLDRETSGIVLIAKNPAACAACAASFNSGKAEKTYLAAVEGVVTSGTITATGILLPDTSSKIHKKLKFIDDKTAACRSLNLEAGTVHGHRYRRVTTSFRKLHDNGVISILKVSLSSGRTHQIRATLAGLGFPLVGDKLYGLDETIFLRFIAGRETQADRRLLRLSRHALHAAKLTLPHPFKEQTLLQLEAPLPPELSSLISENRKDCFNEK